MGRRGAAEGSSAVELRRRPWRAAVALGTRVRGSAWLLRRPGRGKGVRGCRWRAALKARPWAAARPGLLVATAASRSAIDGKQGRSEGGGRAAAVMEWEGGSAGERAGEHSRPGIEHGGSGTARHARRARVPALRAGEGQRGRERGKRERERRGKKKSTA